MGKRGGNDGEGAGMAKLGEMYTDYMILRRRRRRNGGNGRKESLGRGDKTVGAGDLILQHDLLPSVTVVSLFRFVCFLLHPNRRLEIWAIRKIRRFLLFSSSFSSYLFGFALY